MYRLVQSGVAGLIVTRSVTLASKTLAWHLLAWQCFQDSGVVGLVSCGVAGLISNTLAGLVSGNTLLLRLQAVRLFRLMGHVHLFNQFI